MLLLLLLLNITLAIDFTLLFIILSLILLSGGPFLSNHDHRVLKDVILWLAMMIIWRILLNLLIIIVKHHGVVRSGAQIVTCSVHRATSSHSILVIIILMRVVHHIREVQSHRGRRYPVLLIKSLRPCGRVDQITSLSPSVNLMMVRVAEIL